MEGHAFLLNEFWFELTFGYHVGIFWDPSCSVDGGFLGPAGLG